MSSTHLMIYWVALDLWHLLSAFSGHIKKIALSFHIKEYQYFVSFGRFWLLFTVKGTENPFFYWLLSMSYIHINKSFIKTSTCICLFPLQIFSETIFIWLQIQIRWNDCPGLWIADTFFNSQIQLDIFEYQTGYKHSLCAVVFWLQHSSWSSNPIGLFSFVSICLRMQDISRYILLRQLNIWDCT